MKADLHLHTHYSDGSFSPSEVVRLALKRKVGILAITDHDVVSGVKEAVNASRGKNITVIPGIEATAKVRCSQKDTIHIVGLFLDTENRKIKELCGIAKKGRERKTEQKLKLINRYFNSHIRFKDLKKKTKGPPGIPQIALVLEDKGLVKDVKEGISLMIKGGPCFIELPSATPKAKYVIKAIHSAGGKALLAHLSVYRRERKFLTFKKQEMLIKELVSYGIDGIEVYVPNLSKKDRLFGEKMARKYHLLLSGGSDFHDERPGRLPENVLGGLKLDEKKLTVLQSA